MINLILCGGNGTRLWPISRTLMPKQFVKLFDDKSLFQLTVERNSKICDGLLVVSNIDQYFLAVDQMEELHPPLFALEHLTFLLEPVARNTAPAIALACFSLHGDEVVLVTPSDHLIKDHLAYEKAISRAQELALAGYMVTFGITPDFPEIGFGYIEANGEEVKAFHEKPDIQTAKRYLASTTTSKYYWNSGMFCFKASVFLEELQRYSPEIYEACKIAWLNKSSTPLSNIPLSSIKNPTFNIKMDDMLSIPEDSIDYAVMEKSKKVKVVASDINWSDVGSFDALYAEFSKDIDGNTLCEKHISIDSKNNLVMSGYRKVCTIDVEDLIIVDTADALLISKKGSSQKVKQVVGELKKRNTDIHNIHLTAHRPWGTYTVLEDTLGYKIKRIVVNPGKKLSLQKHFHRSEHWIVVSGTATVIVGDQTLTIRPNESTYIKMGEIHRLANDGKIPVVLIEAQVGEYTGEDDIVRIEDEYNRP